MPLIIRIDVDRPYGKHPLHRHILSRISSDFYLPRFGAFAYLEELRWMLGILKEHGAQCYAFFRRCTLPSQAILAMLDEGGHEIGLHLENSTSFDSFTAEKRIVEQHVGRAVSAVSKHGSGGAKFGFHHHAPYEPDKYVDWASRAGMKVFFGNLEDPTLEPRYDGKDFSFFPSAFWLEPSWRDTARFSIEWLIHRAAASDTVLLVHPENIKEDPALTESFRHLLRTVKTRLL